MNINLTFINSTFVNLENLDRDAWISVGKLIAVCSVLVNSLAVFLIVFKSKKETKAYKTALVASHSLLCLAQFQMGFLMCVVPLFPFPALISYGTLRSSFDFILQLQVWFLILISFLWALYATLVIRFRLVVRKDSCLNFSTRTYWISSSVLYFSCVTTVVVMFEILRKPDAETENFLEWKYPKYKNVLKENRLLVFSDKTTLHVSAYSCIGISFLLVTCYVTLSISIFVQVRHSVHTMSAALQNYHFKVLKDIVLQILIKLVTFTFYPLLAVSLYFVTPEYDCIKSTMLLYNVFVAAPIPGTVLLIVQTPSYRRFVFNLSVRVERINPFFVRTQQSTS